MISVGDFPPTGPETYTFSSFTLSANGKEGSACTGTGMGMNMPITAMPQ